MQLLAYIPEDHDYSTNEQYMSNLEFDVNTNDF